MAPFMIVILLIVLTVQCTVITINNGGTDSDQCCKQGVCPCYTLSYALQNLSDNTIINITSSTVLDTITQMGSGAIQNITIVGNCVTISCNGEGAMLCESCNDITIEGIIWDNCGKHVRSSLEYSGLHFTSITNLKINNCTFENSRTGGIALYNTSGVIKIEKTHFISNIMSLQNLHARIYAALLMFYNSQDLNVTIVDSNFINNGYQTPTLNQQGNILVHGVAIQNSASSPIENINVIIESTSFVGNPRGVYFNWRACTASLYASNLTITNSIEEGLFVCMHGCEQATSFHGIQILSSKFSSNANALILVAEANIKPAEFVINSSTFDSNVVVKKWHPTAKGVLSISSSVSSVKANISNCEFLNNVNGAFGIDVAPRKPITECNYQHITITNTVVWNTTTYDDSNATDGSVSIVTVDTSAIIIVEKLTFEYNIYLKEDGTAFKISLIRGCDNPLIGTVNNITIRDSLFQRNAAVEGMATLRIIADEDFSYARNYFIQIVDSVFNDNLASYNIIYINADLTLTDGDVDIIASNFTNNIGNALYYFSSFNIRFSGIVQFANNTAANGAAIVFDTMSQIFFSERSNIYFTNNSVRLLGGAIYFFVYGDCTYITGYFAPLPNNSYVYFINNSADIAGSSIYFDVFVPRVCDANIDVSNNSLLDVPNMFRFSNPGDANFSFITSPYSIMLYPPAVPNNNTNSTFNSFYMQTSKMLGESVTFTAAVFDYFNHGAQPTTFHMKCDNCGSEYVLSKNQISIASSSLQEFHVFPTGSMDVINKSFINIILTSVLSPAYKQLNATLTVHLSSCQRGYHFDSSLVPPQCVCYPRSDIVRCNRGYSEIRIGYWVGYVSDQFTSSVCPNNYCNFAKREETSPGYFQLPRELNEQCSSHRIGVACGECSSGFTLAYVSPNCINSDECSAGITVLVIFLKIIYWVGVVSVVFVVMYFNNQVLSGYVYGIIYYYSIVDTLLGNNLYISEGAFQVVSIISSFAKLTPEVLGRLCFVKGLSGIDQHFIQYSHAVAVSLITLTVVVAARYSLRITHYISRCIIRVICLLILLSYTSLASTSLQLLRPLTFNDINDVHTFLSPEIKYFTGRHLIYAIIALFCELLVIGLPLMLLFEPLIRKKITLTRIKPLLDQFQGCFKDKHHWFAAYYLICRQVIILIVYVGNSNYYNMLFYLQTACIIIAMVHIWFQPYKSDLLNALDGIILMILVLVVNLNTFTFLSSVTIEIGLILVLFPILLYLLIVIRQLVIRYARNKSYHGQYEMNEFGSLQQNASRYVSIVTCSTKYFGITT